MGSGDYYLKIWEDAAAELDLEYDSFEYQEIEGLFWDDPITFVKRYGKALSLEQREHLGYFDVVHGLPEGKEPTKQEILDNWPKPYNQPHLWNKELLKEIHIRRKAFLIGCSKYKSSSFNDLTCPHLDVIAVKKILENKEIGQFGNIISLPENTSAEKAKKQIKDFITSSISGDTLLIYFQDMVLLQCKKIKYISHFQIPKMMNLRLR